MSPGLRLRLRPPPLLTRKGLPATAGPLSSRRSQKRSPHGGLPVVAFSGLASLDIEEAPQLLRTARVAQLSQRLGLYLPDPLAGDVELLADLFKRVVGVHVDAIGRA